MLKILPRNKINSQAWDACVAASSQQVLYGYSWYLDAVLPAPFWKWVGVVMTDETNQYQVVMPIPLRRKRVLGITYSWVAHQPFFCQSRHRLRVLPTRQSKSIKASIGNQTHASCPPFSLEAKVRGPGDGLPSDFPQPRTS